MLDLDTGYPVVYHHKRDTKENAFHDAYYYMSHTPNRCMYRIMTGASMHTPMPKLLRQTNKKKETHQARKQDRVVLFGTAIRDYR
jgi:hypothetical protein